MTVKELKQELGAATPGPWEQLQLGDMSDPYAGLKIKPLMGVHTIATLDLDDAPVEDYNRQQRANARLIVAAVNNLPKLLKVVEAAQTMLDAIDKGAVDSEEIVPVPGDGPPHRFHEEWAHHTRKALEELGK